METKLVHYPKKNGGIFRGDHRFKKLSVAVFTSKGTMIPRNANSSKSILLRREGLIMIRDGPGDGEGKFVSEMGLADPERL